MKALLAIVAVVVVVGAGYFFMMDKNETGDMMSPSPSASVSPSVSVSASPDASASPSTSASPLVSAGVSVSVGPVKTFTLNASNFKFDVKEIKVKQGDTVRLTLKSTGMPHDWVVDELGVRTKVLQSGEQDTIEFVASKKGTFAYYCSIGSHRANGMFGTIIVE